MITEILSQLYRRDLDKLKIEIGQYTSDEQLWAVPAGITNSGGNLALHLVGNLNHFIGAVLGKTGYVRDRDAEFASKSISKDDLLSSIDETSEAVTTTLAKVTADDLAAVYPIEVFGHPMTTEAFLIHLSTHLNYHLGQINYHRRLTSK
jgi:uncharacterized damage-inducible protein DinB